MIIINVLCNVSSSDRGNTKVLYKKDSTLYVIGIDNAKMEMVCPDELKNAGDNEVDVIQEVKSAMKNAAPPQE